MTAARPVGFDYRMVYVATGDWLQPSNDRRWVYRVHSYEDGTDHGLLDVAYASRTFWRVLVKPMPLLRGVPHLVLADLPDRWSDRDGWVELDTCLPTRRAALERAARDQQERAA